MEKTCNKCGQLKPIEDFVKSKDCKDGRKNTCKVCANKMAKEYASKDPERYKKYSKEAYWKHREKRLASITKEERKRLWENWKENNPEKYKANIERQRSKPKHRIRCNLSRRIRHAVVGGIKSKKTEEYIGIDVNGFIDYIEGMFEDWMTWENYKHDTWHIDHIIPCSLYNLENENDAKKCFNYRNMRPLASYENFSKGSELDMAVVENYNIEYLLPCSFSKNTTKL